jgi:hypothetical protein
LEDRRSIAAQAEPQKDEEHIVAVVDQGLWSVRRDRSLILNALGRIKIDLL